MGAEYFYSHEEFEYLYDIDIPPFFSFEFSTFMELYNLSGENGISWEAIRSWSEMRRIRLSQYEIDVILKINVWTNATISELRDSED